METNTATPESEVVVPAKKARVVKVPGAVKAKPITAKVVKAKPTKAEAPKVAEPKVHAHIAAGVDVTMYAGLSSFINATRKVGVRTDVTAGVDDMTDRMQKGLYALRKAYGDKVWGVKGFDNGILAHLASAKLITLSGGHTQVIDGHPKLTDGETPVKAKITAAGMKYGVA